MEKDTSINCDVTIIGGGPAGLCFARALSESGLNIVVLEKSPLSILETPPQDGREIALTHLSIDILKKLNIWEHIPAEDVSHLKQARVMNGESSFFLSFHHNETNQDMLGYMVSNHLIRRASFQALKDIKNVQIITEVTADTVSTDKTSGHVILSDGREVHSKIIIAADSRFSDTRRKMGIATDMHDFGRTVIVCRMKHEKPSHGIAYECFLYGQTLAVLPLNNNMVSIVITLSSEKSDKVLNMSDDDFNAEIQKQFENRLGKMELIGEKYPYPLVGTFAKKFTANRFALLGDAAVGMHPVTAHGFNLGLQGGYNLSHYITQASRNGLDIGSPVTLDQYHKKHRRISRPLYLGTNGLVKLYTAETKTAKIARNAVLRLGARIKPLKKLITNQLTELEKHNIAS